MLSEPVSSELTDPALFKRLALEAVNAAKDAGADYADVRITRTISQVLQTGATVMRGGITESEYVAVGVRALVNNAWGFASSPFWRMQEMPILAKSAVEQAKANVIDENPVVHLGNIPVATGTWTMPVRIDPFTIPISERIDFMTAWMEMANNIRTGISNGQMLMTFKRQERALATTEGAFVIQTVYETGGDYTINVMSSDWRRSGRSVLLPAEGLTSAGLGWELFLDAKLTEQIPKLVAQAEEQLALPTKAPELGRYDILLDAPSVARLLSATFGSSTELDRAMGLEANATGTSYLVPPLGVLTKQTRVASPLVTISANRSLPGGLMTVQWDDEGVQPEPFTVVEQGVIKDFQTTREQAHWLAPWYSSRSLPVRSHGCAAADSAMRITMQHCPNFDLVPSRNDISFEQIVAATPKGLAFFGGGVSSIDYQARNGVGTAPLVREIRNGKLGDIVLGAAFQISANADIWSKLSWLGGISSVQRSAIARFKGEPIQGLSHTVTAVPAKFHDVTVFDMYRAF